MSEHALTLSLKGSRPLHVYLDALLNQSPKLLTDIAKEVGLPRSNSISMMRSGQTKVPWKRIPALAKALNVDPMFLLLYAYKEYEPELYEMVTATLTNSVTKNEMEIITKYREMVGDFDPKMQTVAQKEALENFAKAMSK